MSLLQTIDMVVIKAWENKFTGSGNWTGQMTNMLTALATDLSTEVEPVSIGGAVMGVGVIQEWTIGSEQVDITTRAWEMGPSIAWNSASIPISATNRPYHNLHLENPLAMSLDFGGGMTSITPYIPVAFHPYIRNWFHVNYEMYFGVYWGGSPIGNIQFNWRDSEKHSLYIL